MARVSFGNRTATRDPVSITSRRGHVVADTSGTNRFGGIETLSEVTDDVLFFCGLIAMFSSDQADDFPFIKSVISTIFFVSIKNSGSSLDDCSGTKTRI